MIQLPYTLFLNIIVQFHIIIILETFKTYKNILFLNSERYFYCICRALGISNSSSYNASSGFPGFSNNYSAASILNNCYYRPANNNPLLPLT